MELDKLIVPLIADISKFKSELDKAQSIADTSSNGIASKLAGTGSSMMKVGGLLTATVSAPLLAFGGIAIDTASDLNESMSKAQVVFGQSSKAVQDFASNSAQSLGISKQAALEATGTFGNLFTSMGMNQSASADLSMNVVSLSSDLASFNNLQPQEVLEKLRSGLTGETEPLKSLGININQAMVQAKAMELGLADANGELSTSAITQARYALILDQTKNAQGDFARTSDGLANSTRIATAKFENLKAGLGDRLLPVVNTLMGKLIPFLDMLTKLSPSTMTWIVAIGGVIAILPMLITTIGGVMTGISTIMGVFSAGTLAALAPVIGIVAAVIAIGALLYLAWKNNFLGIRDIVGNAINAISGLWTNTLLPAIQAVWSWMNSTLFPLFRAFGEFLGAVFGLAIRVIAGLWQNVLFPALEKVGNFIKTTFQPVFKSLSDFFNTTLKPVLKDVSDWIGNKLGGAFDKVSKAIQDVIGWLKGMAEKLRNLKLPSWLTPGSPTPWEIALVGINKQFRNLNNTSLPDFASNLNISGFITPDTSNTSTNNLESAINKLSDSKIDERLLARLIRQELALYMG